MQDEKICSLVKHLVDENEKLREALKKFQGNTQTCEICKGLDNTLTGKKKANVKQIEKVLNKYFSQPSDY